MKRIFLRLKQPLRNERGEITFFACFFVVGIVMLISFLLLYASIRITCINIRNGAKMELNNLSGTIYADTYRSQRETNFEEYLNTLYSSSDYTDMLEATVAGGLDSKIPLSTEDYKVSDISLEFNVEDGRVEYIFYCDVEFYVRIANGWFQLTAFLRAAKTISALEKKNERSTAIWKTASRLRSKTKLRSMICSSCIWQTSPS